MLPYNNHHPKTPSTLTDQQAQHPFRVILDFFDDFSLDEILHGMHEELIACLTTDHPSFAHPEQRATLIQRHSRLGPLLESAWLLREYFRTDGIIIIS